MNRMRLSRRWRDWWHQQQERRTDRQSPQRHAGAGAVLPGNVRPVLDAPAGEPEDKNGTICLGYLEAGQSGKVASVLGGHGMLSRLATLGFTPGAELIMVQNFGWGPLIVAIRDTRIALGRGEANRVWVIPGEGHYNTGGRGPHRRPSHG
jgi:ferrous iron transport protein A